MKTMGLRLAGVALLLVFSFFLLWPSLEWYFFLDDETRQVLVLNRESLFEHARLKVSRALQDLRQELALQQESQTFPASLDELEDAFRELARQKGQSFSRTIAGIQETVRTQRDVNRLISLVFRHYESLKDRQRRRLQLGLDLSGGVGATVSLDFSKIDESLAVPLTEPEREQLITRTISILRSKIDQYGLTEPQIRREQGSHRLFVELPGEPDQSRLERFLQGKASLRFAIVDDPITQAARIYRQENPLASEVPLDLLQGTLWLPLYEEDEFGLPRQIDRQYYAVSTNPDEVFPGDYIQSAGIGWDNITAKVRVEFSLTPEGAEAFYRLTDAHQGELMAVVLENQIRSVAGISGPIPGGQVTISGSFSQEDAEDLATVLQTAALPVDLIIDDWSSIGASLGQASIKAGLWAIAMGFILVILFMTLYYRVAGFFASLALVINMVLLLAILSSFGMTLTLTSIAGLVLTVGMAVDANVIIFERIKEELASKKLNLVEAVQKAYQRAFVTIMDANITTFFAAFFLSILGTGAVQGFAWTLAWGIVTSLLSALFISRVFLLSYLTLRGNRLSLSWGGSRAR